MSTVSVILPTYNEKENIEELIKQILRYVGELKEIIVVDDDSPDGTWEIAQRMNEKKVRVIRRTNERGLASAIARGIEEATGEIVVWMDCDLSMPPNVIPKLLAFIPQYDISMGSRYAVGGKDDRGLLRVITSRMINFYANLFLGFRVKDFDSGFIAAKKEIFSRVKLMTTGYGQYCIRFLYDSIKKGYRIKEVGFRFTDREKGVSKSGESFIQLLQHGWSYGIEVLKIRFGG